ncbi:hypothetical protein PAESOLCIP111_02347 [Paenibacillus solanacearum]|uniref:Neutral/alkaline non-lysosomal ceramidase N-terminal domain-containing protein n=1 Tax=Paenibacillus solanacearum TaxID=2048548 RepID=A0A916NQ75_9BACL|nr:neutral/alkaline non-lysosomal ceramidase N-terminal domain-containing protein [Paenibacillus solanacearum]CAG7621528.1 hypothetical protein PAESOLCIP111_02347 [Paenibacillus solanacearum]
MMFLGTSKIDITPVAPVPLCGFASRSDKGPFESVSLPLYARVFYFRSDNSAGESHSAILVSADLIWWGSDRVPLLRRKIRDRLKIEHVILHGSHTHSGPQTSALFSDLLGKVDPAYVAYLESRLLEGIEAAVGNAELVTMARGRGGCDIAINRRGWNNGESVIGPNPEGPVDHELQVIRFMAVGGRVKALLVHYACHPVITRENRVSSEFIGVAMEQLEEAFGDGTVAAYIQGTCGDINPAEGGDICCGGDIEVCRMGQRLAHAVERVLLGRLEPLESAAIQSKTAEIALPLQRLPRHEELEALQNDAGVMGDWSRFLLRSPEYLTDRLTLEITKLTLADGLVLVAMNGEIVVEYGLFLKRISNGTILPMGYSNGMIGYLPTAEQLAIGGYEPLKSTYYFRMPAPFEPSVEELVKSTLLQMFGTNELIHDQQVP